MTPTSKPLVILAIVLLAAVVYYASVRDEMIDFLTWREAAVRAYHAEPLYRTEDGHYQFKYFPLFAVVMAPFALLPPEAGKVVWFASLIVLLAFLLRASITALPARRLSQRTLLLVVIALMAKFYAHELVLGQTNLLLGGLLMGALLAVQRERHAAAGALVGAGVFVKPYALILVPWLLGVSGVRAVASAALVIAAGLLIPAAVYGWDGNLALLQAWARTVTDSTAPNLLGNDNVSIAAMWAKWLGIGPLASSLSWITLLMIAAGVLVVWKRRDHVSEPDYLDFALLLLLIPLISPQGWDYVLLLGTPAVACLVDRFRELARPWQVAVGLALGVMGFTMFDLLGRTLYGQFMALSLITVCALVAGAGLGYVRWRALA
jgi:hypothetical protein